VGFNWHSRIEIKPAKISPIPDVGLVLGEEGGGEEEEEGQGDKETRRAGDRETGRRGDDWTIGRLEDWGIGIFGDVRRDIRLSIFDFRWSIYLEFHGIDHVEMIGIKIRINLWK
jgi:hypothetical protein